MSAASPHISVIQADYANPVHAASVVHLLDAYARDPAGGGTALSDFVRNNLIAELAQRPQVFSVLAFDTSNGTDLTVEKAVGLVNAIEGFSTFACRPLVNVHDLAVLTSHRGQRVGEQLLAKVEEVARQRGACKVTLEVLSGNQSANRLYQRVGFAGYQLDPAMGHAQFLQKWLS
jgi:ribosomal protein S18 acetylase RimI-like enzyme